MIKEVRCALSVLLLTFCGSISVEAAIRWDNPLPQGNVIESIAWNGERYVAVGNSGTVLLKDGARPWRSVTSGTTEWLKSVRWAGNQFVAVGSAGLVLTSPDGESWTRRSSWGNVHLYGIEYAPELERLVAVGESGVVITSQDGERWTRRISNAGDGWLNDVAWNGSHFVAVGGGGTIIRSADGLSWDSIRDLQIVLSSGAVDGPNLQGIAWSGSRWVAVAADSCHEERCIYVSEDNGQTWQPDQKSPKGGLWAVLGHATGFLAVGNDWSVLSSDNANRSWHQVLSPPEYAREDLVALSTDGMNFVVAGQHGLMLDAPSPTGPWERSNGTAGELFDLNAVALSDHGNSYVAVGAGVLLHNTAALETNTIERPTLTVVRSSLQGPLPELRDIAWSPVGYIAVGGIGGIFHSTNGEVWWQDVAEEIPQVELHGVARVAEQWFVVGAQGTILSKANGEEWRTVRTGTELLRSIAATGSELIVAGRAAENTIGVILRGSTAGGTFTRQVFPGLDFRAIAANGSGQYVIVGASGTFLTGDGESWQSGVIDARFHLTDVVWDGTRYVVVGDGGDQGNRGNTFTSTDGFTWERQTLSGNRLNGVSAAGATMVAVGEGGTIVKKACPCAMDDNVRTTRDTPVQVAVLANDIGEALYIVRFDTSTAQGGSVSMHDNMLTYVPPRDFSGTDVFNYTVGSHTDAGQDVASVIITVESVSGTVGDGGRSGGGVIGALGLLGLLLFVSCRKFLQQV